MLLASFKALVLVGAILAVASAQQSIATTTSLVFDRVTVVDVAQGKLVAGQRVVIAGNRIQAVGSADKIEMPQSAHVVDARGKYLIPGLWDMHSHAAGHLTDGYATHDVGEQMLESAIHKELALLVSAGVAPAEAIRAATLNPAKFLDATVSLGTIASGKLADCILLDADPLTDIHNTRAIRAVVANGRYFDRAALDTLILEGRR